MKFGKKKLMNIGIIFLTMVGGVFMTYDDDVLEPTRLELEVFYSHELSACEITEVVTRKYSGKGDYQLFKTNCSETYYPILLDYDLSSTEYKRFTEGLIINKSANSVGLSLVDSNELINLSIRHPSEEDDRYFNMNFVLIFFGTFITILLFIPNSFWERKRV